MTEAELLDMAERAEMIAAELREPPRRFGERTAQSHVADLYMGLGKLARHIYENTDN